MELRSFVHAKQALYPLTSVIYSCKMRSVLSMAKMGWSELQWKLLDGASAAA